MNSGTTLTVFPPPNLESPRLTAEGRFSLVLTGAPGRRYSIEASGDLASWLPQATVTNVAGQVSFTETNSASGAGKFFRARLLPPP